MVPDSIRDIVAANPETPDGGLVRVRAVDVVAACDSVSDEKRDMNLKQIRYGSANHLSEHKTEERRESAIVLVPIGYLRHILKLVG